jgi:hypothetical protein
MDAQRLVKPQLLIFLVGGYIKDYYIAPIIEPITS